MAFKIYTKTGDAGKTSLIGGTKVLKSDLRIEAYGNVDELNSYIGLVNDLLEPSLTKGMLREIQDRLFTVGSALACDPQKEPLMKIPDLLEGDVEKMEKEIDMMNEELPAMKFFILPGGHPAVSTLHVARCVCRRAERGCVHLDQEGGEVAPLVLKYLNRLSDYLFVLSRFVMHRWSIPEIPWKPRVH